MIVSAVDVGSVPKGNFAWCAVDPNRPTEFVGGTRPSDLADHLRPALTDGHLVSLGFECPLVVPVPEDEMKLGGARDGDGNRPWSAAAGGTVLATGLVQLAWLLRDLPQCAATTQPSRWGPDAPLLLWEAFVSGAIKNPTLGQDAHRYDAECAVRGFLARRDDLDVLGKIHVGSARPLNLAAVAAIHAGLRMNADELSLAPRVILGLPAQDGSG